MALFDVFEGILNGAAQQMGNRAKDSLELNKLSGETRELGAQLSSVFERLGRVYYQSRGRDEAALRDLSREADELSARLEELDSRLRLLRNGARCPSCGAGVAEGDRFCAACGVRLPEESKEEQPPFDASYCPECGALAAEGEEYCSLCGKRLTEDTEAEAIPETVYTPDDTDAEAPDDFEAE